MTGIHYSDVSKNYDDIGQEPKSMSSESTAPHPREKVVNKIGESSLENLNQGPSLPSDLAGKVKELSQSSETTQTSEDKPGADINVIEKISNQTLILIHKGERELEIDLHVAILKDDAKSIKALLSNKILDEDKLHNLVKIAIDKGCVDAVQALLSDGRQLSENLLDDLVIIVSRKGEYNRVDLIRALLSDGRAISEDALEATIGYLSYSGDIDTLRALLVGRISELTPNVRSAALQIFASKNCVSDIRELLSDEKPLNELGLGLAVSEAAKNGHLDAIRELLSNGRVIDRSGVGFAVNGAVKNGHIDVLRELLSIQRLDTGQVSSAIGHPIKDGNINIIRELLSNQREIFPWVLDHYFIEVVNHPNFSSDLKITILSELISNGRTPDQNSRETGILFAASQGHLGLLEMLLNQGPIRESVRDSARTQAGGECRESIHTMLAAAQVISYSNIEPMMFNEGGENYATKNRMDVTLSELAVNPEKYLKMICKEGIPSSIFLTDYPNAVDLGGVKKQFISSLSEALGPRLHLTEEKLPFWEQEGEPELMSNVGKFLSLIYKENINRTDKLLTGEIVNPLFFDLVKLATKEDVPEEQILKEVAQLLSPYVPDYAFCFDYILNPTPENGKRYAKVNEEVYLGDLDRDPLKGSLEIIQSFLRPAQGFTKGMTESFKEAILSQDSKTLSLSIQGQAVSSELLLGALVIKDNGDIFLQKVDWLKEKIHSSDKEWQLHFLKAITGKTSMSPGVEINVKKSWRDGYAFECHTCFNSIDLPSIEMEKEAFLGSLDHAIEIKGYNIA